MGNPTNVTNPFETGGESVLKQDMSTRHFLGMSVKTLLALWATKASNVFWQTLPSTYDAVMAALNKWELTYEQLIEIGKKYNGNFNDDQKKVLSGELTKLKLKKEKPVQTIQNKPPLNESPEAKRVREDREHKLKLCSASAKNTTSAFLASKNWEFASGNTLKAKIKPWKNIHIEWDQNDTDVRHDARVDFKTCLASGKYEITLTTASGLPVSLFLFDWNKKPIKSDWSIAPEWQRTITQFKSGEKTIISIPENCKSCTFQWKVTPMDRELIVSDFTIQVTE